MKAVIFDQYGSPEVLRLKEVPKPVPKDNQLLVRIHAAAVTAVDTGYRRSLGKMTSAGTRERIPGYYYSGVVEDTGNKVTRFRKGDAVCGGDVFGAGAHAEYKCVRETGILIQKPEALTHEQAATFIYGGLTALPFLRGVGRIKKGKKLLVSGASGDIGIYAVQLGKYYGAEVTGICRTENIDLVKSLCADKVIDYTAEDFTKNGQAYDIIFDTGAKSSYSLCKNSLTKNGRYLTTVPYPSILLPMLRTTFLSPRKAVFRPMGLRPKFLKLRDLAFLVKLIEEGAVKPVLDRSFPLEQAVEANQYVESGRKRGSVVLSIRA